MFTLVGPDTGAGFFGTLALWLFQTLVPLTIIMVVHIHLSGNPGFRRWNYLAQLTTSGVIGVLLFLPLALAADILSGSETLPASRAAWAQALAGELAGAGPPVVICWVALNAPLVFGYRLERQGAFDESAESAERPESPEHGQSDPVEPSPHPFLPKDHREVDYLKSELHYLQVKTRNGKSLELANLADTVALLDDVAGLSPHRSWWVNIDRVETLKRQGRQGILLMKDGTEVPVSRRRLGETSDALARHLAGD